MSTRRKLAILAATSAVGVGLLIPLVNKLGDQTGPEAIQKMDPDELDRQIRKALPLGTSLTEVQTYLRQPGIEASFDPATNTEFAAIRNVQGSSFVILRTAGFEFAFNDNMRLKSITYKVELTGW